MIETTTRMRRREEIIHAAVIEFCENGYDCTKMEDIAHRAGIGKSTIYEYFPSKIELLTATGDSVLERILLDIKQMLLNDRPVRQALADYLEYISSVMGTIGNNFLNLVGDQEVTNVIHKLCIRYVKTMSSELEGVLRIAQDTGENSPDVNIPIAVSLIISIPSPPFVKLTKHKFIHDSIDQLLALLFSGLAPR